MRPAWGRKRYISGTGSRLCAKALFPCFSRASSSPNCDPSASPSGLLWTVMRMSVQSLSAAMISSGSLMPGLLPPVLFLDLVQEFHDMGSPLRGVVITEEELRDELHSHAPAQLRTDERRSALETFERR